jgi:hypothetical protein
MVNKFVDTTVPPGTPTKYIYPNLSPAGGPNLEPPTDIVGSNCPPTMIDSLDIRRFGIPVAFKAAITVALAQDLYTVPDNKILIIDHFAFYGSTTANWWADFRFPENKAIGTNGANVPIIGWAFVGTDASTGSNSANESKTGFVRAVIPQRAIVRFAHGSVAPAGFWVFFYGYLIDAPTPPQNFVTP